MTELERAKMDAHIALLKVAEEVSFAAYRVNTKDPSVTYFPEIAPSAKLADVALAAVAAARIAENDQHDTIRAAADRTAEAAQGQLRQS